jgi:MFS family permease
MAYGFSVFLLPLSTVVPGAPTCGAETGWVAELTASCNWRVQSINTTFMLFTAVLGIAAAVWGRWLERVGPRKAAVVAAVLWCGGLLLGALAIVIHQLWLLWLGTGLIGGIGLGLGYISPISVLIRWFPDRRGMATGLAVMGFGGGAMVGAPLAVLLMKHFQTADSPGIAATFVVLALIYSVFMLAGAFGYRLPARGWQPTGWAAPESELGAGHVRPSVPVSRAWKTPAFWCLWGMLCVNASAGVGILSVASPMLQEIFGGRLIGLPRGIAALSNEQRSQIAVIAVGFTGLLSLFNISGRFVWAVVSDHLGRRVTCSIFFLVGVVCYATLPVLGHNGQLIPFVTTLCVMMSIFGGMFAILPAYVADLFGTEMVAAIQGRVLTAWSLAAGIGPFVINESRGYQIDHGIAMNRAYEPAFYVFATLMAVGLVCNLRVRPAPPRHCMSERELAEHRGAEEPLDHSPLRAGHITSRFALRFVAVTAWLCVGIPIAWGAWMAFKRAAQFI